MATGKAAGGAKMTLLEYSSLAAGSNVNGKYRRSFAGSSTTAEPTGTPLLSFDLQAELRRLRAEDHPWQAGRNAKILVKYPDFRILLIALRPGAHMAKHKTIGSVSVQTVSGHVLVRAEGKVFDLPEGSCCLSNEKCCTMWKH